MAATTEMTLQDASTIPTQDDAERADSDTSYAPEKADFSTRNSESHPVENRAECESERLSHEARAALSEKLITEHHADVYRFACWLSGSPTAAEDICQETFLRAYRGIHTLREEEAARGWLLTITRNEFSRWCKRNRERNLPESAEECLEHHIASADEPSAFVEAEWVRKALDELPDNYRTAVMMYYFEEKTYAEISEVLDVPLGTVMSRLSRAKQHLKQHLQD